MTRINLVPVEELADQHLMAEWREIKMVPAALRRALKTKSYAEIDKSIPVAFCLGTGHVRFFYNKLGYLNERYEALTKELLGRGYNIKVAPFPMQGISYEYFGTYYPTMHSLSLVRKRIQEKINLKPGWYRWTNFITV